MAIRPDELGAGPLDALARAPLLARLDAAERRALLACAQVVTVPAQARVHGAGDAGHHLDLVLEGAATLRRADLPLRRLGPGDHFGELAPLRTHHRGETVTAETPLTLARLSARCWEGLERDRPALAAKLAGALAATLSEELVRLTSEMGLLLRGRSLPRAAEVTVRALGEELRVRTGTRLADLLPAEVDGALVVAGLLGQKPVSLATPVFTDSTVAPLTLRHWEGRAIYAHSVGLLLLEAAHTLAPSLHVRMGASRGKRQIVELAGVPRAELPGWAARIAARMERLAQDDAPIRLEYWPTDEAAAYFSERGWDDAARLLRVRRQATVRLVSCGELYALSMGPLLPSTGALRGFRLEPCEEGLALDLGERDPRNGRRGGHVAPPPADGGMVAEHQRWLEAFGVTSVGAFNDLCISGQVSQLIRVAEGFHEKRIGHIADAIAARRDQLRVIAIAGPSSSGKSTFIKRLTVQLQIDGVNPVALGLDDYYVDREKTPRDEAGEWDFEALEAIDLPLLHDHVRRLIAGEPVRTARYDFLTGTSHPDGGPLIQFRPGDVLLVEGIHGLDPRLLDGIPPAGALYRVFIHPATTLPFDRLTRTSATDLRLLRRIVRDRHRRGYGAAENILRWPSVQAGEREHIFPHQHEADAVFDSSLVYEPAVLKVFAERYLLEVPPSHPAYPTAHRLRYLVDRFVSIYPDHVPPTSLLREFIGGSGFEY
ncbi:cyclic nucleotide-binding domain-containing protein [Anaeromyxobacter sp. Fw109-5]|uniref:cyclic nucleotide-binding domain-containing protein n=1 Tax=Anaeromyxobacter sp. (strain Fw109-5) TaxID=404589 RepID=UPI0000ED6CA4|nr:cyclic nucleotide-binding domain-containing protein [Anaeromyxobacter sp. Fw109-5]ABS28031.1 cyclic nucleotide-binding protein [Anaeromyxobacter sp. Fw109-5]